MANIGVRADLLAFTRSLFRIGRYRAVQHMTRRGYMTSIVLHPHTRISPKLNQFYSVVPIFKKVWSSHRISGLFTISTAMVQLYFLKASMNELDQRIPGNLTELDAKLKAVEDQLDEMTRRMNEYFNEMEKLVNQSREAFGGSTIRSPHVLRDGAWDYILGEKSFLNEWT